MKFKATGTIKLGGGVKPFSKEIEAKSEKEAREFVYNAFGSDNGIKRTAVRIDKLEKE